MFDGAGRRGRAPDPGEAEVWVLGLVDEAGVSAVFDCLHEMPAEGGRERFGGVIDPVIEGGEAGG